MKKFGQFALYMSSIALAVGIGMFQVGGTYGKCRLNEGGILESCTWSGYGGGYWCIYEYRELDYPCTTGNFNTAKAFTFPSYYRVPLIMPTTRVGNCKGATGCKTPKTARLVSYGCEE